MTKKELAEKLGITRPTLYKWLADPQTIPVVKYQQLLALNVKLPPIKRYIKCEFCKGSGIAEVKE